MMVHTNHMATTATCTTKPQPSTGRRHVCSVQHLTLVTEYRAARMNDEQRRDEAVGIYGCGSPEWVDHGPLLTFRAYLEQMKGSSDAEE